MNTKYIQLPVEVLAMEDQELYQQQFQGCYPEYQTTLEQNLFQQQQYLEQNEWCQRVLLQDCLWEPEQLVVKIDRVRRCVVLKLKNQQQQQLTWQQYPEQRQIYQKVKRVIPLPQFVPINTVKVFVTPRRQILLKAAPYYIQEQQLDNLLWEEIPEIQQQWRQLDMLENQRFDTLLAPAYQQHKVLKFLTQLRRCLLPLGITPRIQKVRTLTTVQHLCLELQTLTRQITQVQVYCKPEERKLVIELPREEQLYGPQFQKIVRHEIRLPKWLLCNNMRKVQLNQNVLRLHFPCVLNIWQQQQQLQQYPGAYYQYQQQQHLGAFNQFEDTWTEIPTRHFF